MDSINYLPHGSQRLASRSDPVHGSAGGWVTGPHGLATPAWSPGSSDAALYLSRTPPRPRDDLDVSHPSHSSQFGWHGALPHPDRSLRGAQHQDVFAGLPTPPAPFGTVLHSIPGLPSAASTSHGGLILHPADISAPGLGALALQPQASENMAPSGVTSETNALRGSILSSPDRPANALSQQVASPFSTPNPPYTFTPLRPVGPGASPTVVPRLHRPGAFSKWWRLAFPPPP